jgi:hypothetical protein
LARLLDQTEIKPYSISHLANLRFLEKRPSTFDNLLDNLTLKPYAIKHLKVVRNLKIQAPEHLLAKNNPEHLFRMPGVF